MSGLRASTQCAAPDGRKPLRHRQFRTQSPSHLIGGSATEWPRRQACGGCYGV
jgi:hypothetical protein